MKQKVILITGASSGIGYDTATRLAKQGHKVYGAARRIDKMQPLKELGVTPIKMDVTDDASMIAGVNAVMEAEGRIDVLVNNAGYGYFGAIENVSMEEARKQLEVNVFGLARLTQLVIPHMRQQGSGRIVNLASIAGKLALYFGGWYHVSKFAVEGFSDALRMELKPFGIDVVIIEPGGIRTEWGIIAADHLAESSKGTVYEQAALNEANAMKYTYTRAKLLSNPSVIAKAICKGVNKRHPKARYRTGMGSHSLVFLHWLLPSKWWDGLMRSLGKVRVER
jgi:NAD(P)-dependent dehydrogenase (short-subunit alcohol dehydrogenase family)